MAGQKGGLTIHLCTAPTFCISNYQEVPWLWYKKQRVNNHARMPQLNKKMNNIVAYVTNI
eukprot:NODE_4641_length_312_cov_36.247148_g4559_i0.p3 GENE.NODE_4641_length_312_cov_36.247148_g4559_i0~~NODE_4641_length_312_cov_36.247148_g4559_i0.p3  ORF type:complete len:60 (+),score=6.97 NODE_4641_length_312_cov_36.247148_g4559_i0:107-286(+)